MKKLLTILSSFAVTATSASAVIACDKQPAARQKTDDTPTVEQDADDAVTKLSQLKMTDVMIKPSELGDSNKAETLSNRILADDKIKNIIKGDLALEGGKFNLKVDGKDADDTNLKHCSVKASGKLSVKGQTFNKEFAFNVLVEEYGATIVNSKLMLLRDKVVTIELSKLGATDKITALNKELLAHDEINNIITGDVKIKDDKFTLKKEHSNNVIKENELITGIYVKVTGLVEINGEAALSSFMFKIQLI